MIIGNIYLQEEAICWPRELILYAYMNNIYSCRKIEKAVQRDIHYIWLATQERPDYVTINRFRHFFM